MSTRSLLSTLCMSYEFVVVFFVDFDLNIECCTTNGIDLTRLVFTDENMNRLSHLFTFDLYARIHAAIKLTLPTRHDLVNKLISKRSPEEIDAYAEEIVHACNTIERTTPVGCR
jgi:hypothetical protein